jgi:hypothetical protein
MYVQMCTNLGVHMYVNTHIQYSFRRHYLWREVYFMEPAWAFLHTAGYLRVMIRQFFIVAMLSYSRKVVKL